MLYSLAMELQTKIKLMNAIATREGTAKQLAERFGITVTALKEFAVEHRDGLELIAGSLAENDTPDGVLDPNQLDELWITKKFERLRRYQTICDLLFKSATTLDGHGLTDATTLRELRSFMRYAAEELGQLLHRGAGNASDDSTVTYTITGVDMDDLK